MAVARGERFGKYRIERALATGGMAELYLARQSGPGGFEKQVVIKRILPHLTANPELVHMFLDEARIAARLSHPNIVQVFDFGEAGGGYFLVMEYLAGEDLATILAALRDTEHTMPFAIAALITSAVCEALQYAHSFVDEHGTPLKIVHRDISPSNIFLTLQGVVKVLDFGVAKAEGNFVHTKGGVLKGKPFYMSPEQIRGQELDGRSDVFALGAVLHELLTGWPTFERDSVPAALKAIADEPIPRPSELVEGVPMDLEAVVSRALEREPRLRWQSASDMRLALDRFIAKRSSAPSSGRLEEFLHELVDERSAIERASRLSQGASPWEAGGGPFFHQSSRPVAPAPSGPAGAATAGDLATVTGPRGRRRRLAVGGALLAVIVIVGWGASGVTEPEPASLCVPASPIVTPAAPPAPAPEASPRLEAVRPSPPTARPAPPPVSRGPTVAPPLWRAAVSRPTADTGRLDVNCIPWCRVYIDGKDLNLSSPVKGIVLSVGLHTVRLVNPPSRVARELPVQVSAGATVRHLVRF